MASSAPGDARGTSAGDGGSRYLRCSRCGSATSTAEAGSAWTTRHRRPNGARSRGFDSSRTVGRGRRRGWCPGGRRRPRGPPAEGVEQVDDPDVVRDVQAVASASWTSTRGSVAAGRRRRERRVELDAEDAGEREAGGDLEGTPPAAAEVDEGAAAEGCGDQGEGPADGAMPHSLVGDPPLPGRRHRGCVRRTAAVSQGPRPPRPGWSRAPGTCAGRSPRRARPRGTAAGLLWSVPATAGRPGWTSAPTLRPCRPSTPVPRAGRRAGPHGDHCVEAPGAEVGGRGADHPEERLDPSVAPGGAARSSTRPTPASRSRSRRRAARLATAPSQLRPSDRTLRRHGRRPAGAGAGRPSHGRAPPETAARPTRRPSVRATTRRRGRRRVSDRRGRDVQLATQGPHARLVVGPAALDDQVAGGHRRRRTRRARRVEVLGR